MVTQPRVKAGAPGGRGGQWAPFPRDTSDVSLEYTRDQDWVEQQVYHRSDELRKYGMLPATATFAATGIGDTNGRDVWWDRSATVAEYSYSGMAEIPKMPDDESFSFGAGRALSGRRRTYRKTYSGPDGFDVRMPAATAVRRYMEREGLDKIQFPVQYDREDGKSMLVWVTMAANGDGTYTAGWVSDSKEAGRKAALIAQAAMERRTYSDVTWKDLYKVQDYTILRNEVPTPENVEFVPTPRSSVFDQVGYDKHTGRIGVRFRGSGKVYSYEASENMFNRLVKADSPGAFYTAHIKNKKINATVSAPNDTARQVETCGACGAWLFAGAMSHECPGKYGQSGSGRAGADYRRQIVEGHSRAARKVYDQGGHHSEKAWSDTVGNYHSGSKDGKRKGYRKRPSWWPESLWPESGD